MSADLRVTGLSSADLSVLSLCELYSKRNTAPALQYELNTDKAAAGAAPAAVTLNQGNA